MHRYKWVSTLWLVGVLGLAACRSPVEVLPTVVGTITEVQADPFTILIVEDGPDPCGYRFRIDSTTEVRAAASAGAAKTDGKGELRVGVRVSAWADGEMLLSCPAIGRAATVLVGS